MPYADPQHSPFRDIVRLDICLIALTTRDLKSKKPIPAPAERKRFPLDRYPDAASSIATGVTKWSGARPILRCA